MKTWWFSFWGLGLSESGNLGSGLLQGGQQADKNFLFDGFDAFSLRNLQVWGRVEVFVEGLLLQENELRLSEISEGLEWQDQQKKGYKPVTVFTVEMQVAAFETTSDSSGRVEIVKDNQWGTIDDTLFNNLDAQVICRSASCDGLAWPTTCQSSPEMKVLLD